MRSIKVRIKGVTPLLMNKFNYELPKGFQKMKPEEQAEYTVYKDADGVLYVPAVCLHRAMINGGKFTKKGKGTLSLDVACGVEINPFELTLNKSDYDVDIRRVVIQRSAIPRCRALVKEWECEFDLNYDEVLFSENVLREILDNTGSRVGLLDFRPEKKGIYGKFMVTSWK